MRPSLPIDISESFTMLEPIEDPEVAGLQKVEVMKIDRVELLETRGNPLECSMLRGEFRCSNETRSYIVAHAPNGHSYLIPFCQMCVDDSGEGWLQSLERLAQAEQRARIIVPRHKIQSTS